MSQSIQIARTEASIQSIANVDLTEHSLKRMHQRGLSDHQVELALQYGRKIHSRRAVFHAIGRKEIARYGDVEPALRGMDGVQVVTTADSSMVITVYRNHDLRAIRPTKRKHRHMH